MVEGVDMGVQDGRITVVRDVRLGPVPCVAVGELLELDLTQGYLWKGRCIRVELAGKQGPPDATR
jgi:hypothetical protein